MQRPALRLTGAHGAQRRSRGRPLRRWHSAPTPESPRAGRAPTVTGRLSGGVTAVAVSSHQTPLRPGPEHARPHWVPKRGMTTDTDPALWAPRSPILTRQVGVGKSARRVRRTGCEEENVFTPLCLFFSTKAKPLRSSACALSPRVTLRERKIHSC